MKANSNCKNEQGVDVPYRNRAAHILGSLFWLIALAVVSATPLIAQDLGPPALNEDAAEQVATAGYYTLSWTLPAGTDGDEVPLFELVEASDAGFADAHPRYRGPDLATTISGKADGTYFYRVRLAGEAAGRAGAWSNTHRVVVAHHPLSRAFAFLIVGALVFAATLGVILYGHHRERRGPSAHVA